MAKKRRVFFALKPDDEGIDFLTNRIQLYRGRGFERFGRFIQSEDLHLTIRFIGEVEPEVLDTFIERAAVIAQGSQAIHYKIDRCVYFPRVSRARVIAAQVIGTPELKALAQQMEALAVELGCEPEKWGFKPHITIARLKKGMNRPNLPNRPGAVEQKATEMLLLESTMSDMGAEYEVIQTFSLGDASGSDDDFDEF